MSGLEGNRLGKAAEVEGSFLIGKASEDEAEIERRGAFEGVAGDSKLPPWRNRLRDDKASGVVDGVQWAISLKDWAGRDENSTIKRTFTAMPAASTDSLQNSGNKNFLVHDRKMNFCPTCKAWEDTIETKCRYQGLPAVRRKY